MTKDKLRLLLLDDCNRNCPGCCNRDWDLQALPLCQDYTPYRLIMLTGGEPMLYPEIIREAIAAIRRQTNVPIYLYTAMPEQLDMLMPLLDGVTVTLHTPEDIPVFQSFDRTAQNLTGKSLRLNVFDEVGTVICRPEWQVKDHMRWIPNTSTPDYYANDRRIQRDVIIEVVAGGRVIALDGNGDFEGKRPFVPFNEFEKSLANSFAGQQPKLRSYEEMKAKLLSLPGGEAYADPHRYWENWVFNLDFRHVTEQIVGAASWMGVEFHILAIQYTHIPTGFVFTNYRFRPASLPSGSDSRPRICLRHCPIKAE